MIRIAVSGSHGVGKTTLVDRLGKALSARGIHCAIATEPIRKIAADARPDDPRSNSLRLIEEHFHRLDQPGYDCCIYDRTLLDMLAYLRISDYRSEYMESMVFELLRWHWKYFDAYIYLPIEFALAPEGVKARNERHRQEIDAGLRTLAEQTGIDMIEVRGSVESRTRQVLALAMDLISTDPAQPATGTEET
jgi:predicted ATPase